MLLMFTTPWTGRIDLFIAVGDIHPSVIVKKQGAVVVKALHLMLFPGALYLLATYVYDTLDGTPAQRLEGEQNIYGKGMWAASLRYHQGKYYICFVANDTHRTWATPCPQ